MGGSSLLTYFIVLYTKGSVDKVFLNNRISTDAYAVLVAFFVLLTAQVASGANVLDWRIYGLTLANGFLIAATAAQIQNKAINPPGTITGSIEQKGKD
jgi:hypothetical protein